MPRNPSMSINLGHEAVGSSQTPLRPVATGTQVCTNTTVATIATIIAKTAIPAQSSDLSAANCCFAIKRDPTYNLVLKPIVGHASSPDNLWGQAYLVGVRELVGREGDFKYIREVLGYIKFQGSSTTFTPSATADGGSWPGLGTAPSPAVWSGCDVLGTTPYIPNPAISEMGEIANGWGSFAMDTWSHPWLEIYPACFLPTDETGTAASAISFWFSEC